MQPPTDAAPIEMPMFPLGSVLFPGATLPLHIFEPRYQQLLNTALEADRRFGVVLISRGSEVGGGDVRNDIGTIAEIQGYQRFDDGRAAVVCVGTRRIEVVEWLDDDPFPRARVSMPDDSPGDDDERWFLAARSSLSAVLSLAERQGRVSGLPTVEWSDDLEAATWQLAAVAPLSPLDQYSVLAKPNRRERLRLIDSLLRELHTDLELLGGLE